MKKEGDGLVYSTEFGRVCPGCGKSVGECVCAGLRRAEVVVGDGIVRIARQTKGRGGKGVCLISGLPLSEVQLKELAGKLKAKCGTGGTVKDGIIEIQGDNRERLQTELEKLGYKVKLAGG